MQACKGGDSGGTTSNSEIRESFSNQVTSDGDYAPCLQREPQRKGPTAGVHVGGQVAGRPV